MAYSRYCAVGLESSFGTEKTTLKGVNVRSIEPSVDRQVLYDETIEDYLPIAAVGGPLKVELSAEFALRHGQIIEWLVSNMGSYSVVDTSGIGDGPYEWTFTLGSPRSLTIEVGEESDAKRYIGCAVNSLEFSFSAREMVSVSADMIGKTYKDVTFAEPTYSTEKPMAFWQAQLKVAGSKVAGAKEASLKIDRGIADDEYVLDDFTLYRIAPERTEISGSLTLTEDEYDELNRALYGSASGSTSEFTKANYSDNPLGQAELEIVCSDGTYSFTATATAAIYEKGSYSLSGRDRIDRKIDYKVLSGFQIVVTTNRDETTL